MKEKEWKNLKKGDEIYHKHFGLCEVVDFIAWWGAPKDPVIMPKTQEGKILLFRQSGMEDAPMLETSKRLISKTPFTD
jgi:hypothetical protein